MERSMNTQCPRAMTQGNEAFLQDKRQSTIRSMSSPPGGGPAMDGTIVHYGTDPDLVPPSKPQGSASGFNPGAVSRESRQIVDLDQVHAESNARRRAHRSASPRFCSHRADLGARGLAEGVAHVAAPIAASGTLMTAATACGAAIVKDVAGAAMESVPYVGTALRPAVEVLGALNGAAAGAATGAILAQSLRSARRPGQGRHEPPRGCRRERHGLRFQSAEPSVHGPDRGRPRRPRLVPLHASREPK